MKAFLKTVIGGALGLGALYVVGKICYEAGKDVAEIERQLETNELVEGADTDGDGIDISFGDETIRAKNHVSSVPDNSDKKEEPAQDNTEPGMFSRFVGRVKNAKLFLSAKKAFDKSGKKPGILSSLLTNPDGAKIEAYVRDGGVQINVKPRAA
jgi:hypothetical protein